MRHEVMLEMSKGDLDGYASALGIDVSGKKTVEQKAAAIEDARGRFADIGVLGTTVCVPVKRLHDKRVTDIADRRPMSDDDAMELLGLLLGDGQLATIVERATDDDGTVDNEALAFAMATILRDDDLKNF